MTDIAHQASKEKKADVFELICIWIASVSLISISLLVVGSFHPLVAMILGSILFFAFLYIFKITFSIEKQSWTLGLFFILFLALLLRINPYVWIMGGQDQGIYVNMSSYYEKIGEAFITDQVREKLDETGRVIYDETNHHSRFQVKTNEMLGFHQPGIYISNLAKSEYVFQFYPMHPLWMSIFGSILGSDNRVYSLVFFSLISILAFYRIAIELSPKTRKSAYLIAILLATSPLHAFFSKFPVSEILSLAFSSTGFYMLLKYYKASLDGDKPFWRLLISAGLFLGLFMNHISGFLYLPIFYLISILAILFVEDKATRKQILLYCGLILLGYILSALYGFFYSFPYFWQIGASSFGRYFGEPWYQVIFLAAAAGLVFVIFCTFFRNQFHKISLKLMPHIKKYFPLILYAFILIGLYQAYELTFTDKWVGDPTVDERFNLARNGIIPLISSTVIVVLTYLTPFGFLAFLMAINFYRQRNNTILSILFVFLILSWFMRVIMDPVITYQYYFTRYLSGDVLPYSLLLIALYVGHLFEEKKSRFLHTFAILSTVIMITFSSIVTSFQMLGQEAKGPQEAIKHIDTVTTSKDIILLYGGHLNRTLGTPLSYYYHQNTMVIDGLSQINWKSLFETYENIYFISQNEFLNKHFELLKTFDYSEEILQHTSLIPTKFITQNRLTLRLYRVEKELLESESSLGPKILSPALFNKVNFAADNNWTFGEGTLEDIEYKIMENDKYLVLHTGGRSPYAKDMQQLQLELYINDTKLAFIKQDNFDYIFELDRNISTINRITIKSATFIPEEFGINGDSRSLGVDVSYLEILPTYDQKNFDITTKK